MKKNSLLIVLLIFMTVHAHAQERCPKDSCSYQDGCCVYKTNFYAKIFGGANFLQNTSINGNNTSYQTGYIFAGSFGNCWRQYGLHLEGEYAFRRNAIRKIHFITQGYSTHGHFQTSSYMMNLLWDLLGCRFWKIQPFVGAGVGYDFQQMRASNSRIDFNQKWNHVSWQVMAGLGYSIIRDIELTLEYKFHQGGHFNNNAVGLGLVYKFGFLK
jgi:opacity protein-like surface antigen